MNRVNRALALVRLLLCVFLLIPSYHYRVAYAQNSIRHLNSSGNLLQKYAELLDNVNLRELESSTFSWTDKKDMPKLRQIQLHKNKSGFTAIGNNMSLINMRNSEVEITGRNRNKSLHRQAHYKKKRRGRGHHQKLNKNVLRLLDSQTEKITAGGLFPPLFNVAPRSFISVNATCGQNGREEYCKLVDAYPHKKFATQCGICNSQSSDAAKQRPIESVISNKNFEEQWWQSPTLQQGKHFEYITITLDLQQIYQVFFITIKCANSPRPASWILEKSIDGHSYSSWQYFGASDGDCRQRYGLPAQTGKYIFQNDTEVICTTQYSKVLPMENGEMHISLLKNRPGAIEQNSELMEFITARYIRIRFQGLHSSGSIENNIDWLMDPQSLEKRSFYSLKQIRVSARLDCHGHANKTVEILDTHKRNHEFYNVHSPLLKCLCQHNTCENDCSKCCSLFQGKPFRNGNYHESNECEKCQCNEHATDCVYDEIQQRGICQNCENNADGIECELCKPKYFRAHGALLSDHCQPCNCTQPGASGLCNPQGGQCDCLPGFEGDFCEKCAPGHHGSACKKCDCDVRGTISNQSCPDLCQCKKNAMGNRCSTCKTGFYDLSADNPEGCTACWCSNVGLSCSSALLQSITFETLYDWKITDASLKQTALPTLDTASNFLIYGMYDLSTSDLIFWQAPSIYIGNRLTSYGSKLSISVSWVSIRGDTSGKPTCGPLVIFLGNNGLRIAFGDEEFPRVSRTEINIKLVENNWYHYEHNGTSLRHNNYHGSSVTRAEFLSVLASVKSMLIRGSYHTDQVESVLERVVLFSGGVELGQEILTQVEQCICPDGYAGLSCESCDFGYIRDYNNFTEHRSEGKCVPCPCNGHSNSCDLQNGKCNYCMHNTYGERCERCLTGFYGNPLHGTPNDCKQCACPLIEKSNNFSPSCQLKSSNLGEVEDPDYICTQCPEGYTGDHCQKCDDGFFGNPMKIGGNCQPCDCDGDPCDVVTGQCIICNGNTEGWQCERCKIGYWGDPSISCEPCNCYTNGSDSGVCDSTDGQCLCKQRFAGKKCDQCDTGYAAIKSNCLPCDCHPNGTQYTNDCDPNSGQCECKTGTIGLKCNKCDSGYFGGEGVFEGCQECQCNISGSVSNICDRHGQCTCLPNVGGRQCDTCISGYWNFTQGIGCQNCRCDPIGSRNLECNLQTGQCSCKPGVGGPYCDSCLDGFYGFSSDGCQECPHCATEGQVCDPLSGRCICPPNTRGLGCAQCVSGTWGWQLRSGCRQCDCDYSGSIGQICEPNQGQCQCKEGYTGRKCGTCAFGYFGYPECRRCNCNQDGSFSRSDGPIPCDSNGQCPCKSLVVGLKCDTCMQSTFGLSYANPEGCTKCFCFGRTIECEQSEWSWGHIRMAETRNLTVHYLSSPTTKTNKFVFVSEIVNIQFDHQNWKISKMNGLDIIPGTTQNITIETHRNFKKPLYIELPEYFNGDRTSSYGGSLIFTLLTEGAHKPIERQIVKTFPIVEIVTHNKLILDFYDYEQYEYSLNVTYRVPLLENYWKNHESTQSIDRSTLMIALQNIKHIYLRASAFAHFSQVIIQNVHMDSAIYVFGSTNLIARSVEKCKCPKKYDGLSCQDPGKGYYRFRNDTEISKITIDDLIGRALPCHCNSRSNECDRETAICKSCKNNTGGSHCQECAEGYYGDPNGIDGCQPCPCPSTSLNFARGCKISDGEVHCICKPGYTGKLCDMCETNYFGNPLVSLNGTCELCNCNRKGILSEGCDINTGQCHCRSGITGLKCNTCVAPRHYLENGECKVCDNCSLALLNYMEIINHKLRREIQHIDFTYIPAPYIKTEEYENLLKILRMKYYNYNNARQQLNHYDTNNMNKLNSLAENNMYQLRKALNIANKYFKIAENLHHNLSDTYTDINALKTKISETIIMLSNYGKEEKHLSLPIALEQARFYLNAIKNHRDSIMNIQTSTQCAWYYYYIFGNASDAAFDRRGDLEMFWRNLNQTNFRISDLRFQVDKILDMQNNFDDIFEHIINRKYHLMEDYHKINEISSDIHTSLNQTIISATKMILESIFDNLGLMSEKIDALVKLNKIVDSTLIKREESHREVRKHWLPKAQKHAERLMERFNEYARQFQPTKNGARIALFASSVHKNISNAITGIRQAVDGAKMQILKTHDILYPKNGQSLPELAVISIHKSILLNDHSIAASHRTNALLDKYEQYEKKVDAIQKKIYEAGIKTNNITLHLHPLQTVRSRNLAWESIEITENVTSDVRTISQDVKQIDERLKMLRRNFAILEPDWEIKLGMAEENISLTKTNIRLANISLIQFEEQAIKQKGKFDEWNNTMSRQLQELRDKIAKAKHAADSIKVSLKSLEPKCVRGYLPTSYGLSISNNIKLNFALANHHHMNSPILYMQGIDGHFISLELFKKRVRLVWNLGGTTATLTHPLTIEVRDPKYDDAWYYVKVNRTLNIGSLSVRRMNNIDFIPSYTIVTNYSDAEHTRFIQTSRERNYLGEYPPYIIKRHSRLQPGLNVVTHLVEIDNTPIGLWNFVSSKGKCDGAIFGAQEASALSTARHFNGFGYAKIEKLRVRPYRKNIFALQISFKTLDENALLFLAVDDRNNRSVSVTLNRGHIMFRIDYGDGAQLEINSAFKYNTGKWVKIEAAREFVPKRGTENGILRVNNDKAITGSPTVPIKNYMLPDLSNPVYYLGGIPPGFVSGITKAPGADNAFLGCIMDVQVNGETYDPLESSTFYGVVPSCKETTTKAGFMGDGYIELHSQSLRKKANIGLIFRTMQLNCLLMLSAYPPHVSDDYDEKDIKGNYSISLIDGRLHFWLNIGGNNILKMSSNNTFNNGMFHFVNILKSGRKFELMVDDVLQETKQFQGNPVTLSMPTESGGLYVGGAPDFHEYTSLSPTSVKLKGSIRDIVFYNKTINFNTALAFVNVEIGRNGPVMGVVENNSDELLKTEPMIAKSFTARPEGCIRSNIYSYEPNAFKFGDVPKSYAQVSTKQRNFWQHNFRISFSFRSFYPNGLIFVTPTGSKEKPKHYVSLMLKDGQLLFVVRGRRREDLKLTAKLNDGEWHRCFIAFSNRDRKLTISVKIGLTDQETSAQMKVPKRIITSQTFWIGGLPDNHLPKLPSELLMKIEPFKGCLRNFSIDDNIQDLAKLGNHMNVGQCFPKVERGSYFPGDAYVIYKKNFQVGKYLDLKLELRTSDLSGVLLSVSESTGFPALSLELFNGNIIFSCDIGNGVPLRVQTKFRTKYTLCDNKWHNITAIYDDKEISLKVDKLEIISLKADHHSIGKVQTNSALYLGGIPDIAPSGSLLSRDNFKGCLKNIFIRNEHRDWIDMEKLHNVLLGECQINN